MIGDARERMDVRTRNLKLSHEINTRSAPGSSEKGARIADGVFKLEKWSPLNMIESAVVGGMFNKFDVVDGSKGS